MKTKTNNTTQIKLTASENLKDALPKVLIDYLWSLIYSESASKNALQVFKLSKNQLNGRDVQDILHFTGNSEFPSNHRVFGFMPVNEEIHVICIGKDYHMILAKEKICYEEQLFA